MAYGKAKSLSWVPVAGQTPAAPATGTITSINGYATNDGIELVDHMEGNFNTPRRYRGTVEGFIKIEVDAHKAADFVKGMEFNTVVLTVESTVSSGGISGGADTTWTLSDAVLTELTDIEKDNEDNAPAVRELTFTLSMVTGTTAQPTMVRATVGGGGG